MIEVRQIADEWRVPGPQRRRVCPRRQRARCGEPSPDQLLPIARRMTQISTGKLAPEESPSMGEPGRNRTRDWVARCG